MLELDEFEERVSDELRSIIGGEGPGGERWKGVRFITHLVVGEGRRLGERVTACALHRLLNRTSSFTQPIPETVNTLLSLRLSEGRARDSYVKHPGSRQQKSLRLKHAPEPFTTTVLKRRLAHCSRVTRELSARARTR